MQKRFIKLKRTQIPTVSYMLCVCEKGIFGSGFHRVLELNMYLMIPHRGIFKKRKNAISYQNLMTGFKNC